MKEMSEIFPEMTIAQEKQWFAEQQEEHRLDLEREKIEIAKRKPIDHHIHCRDCGSFVQKWRWVRKDHPQAISQGWRPMCGSCFENYDNYP
jgi:heterodisulfide reductase subunit B